MTILANCKMTSATGKPSNYVILSEVKLQRSPEGSRGKARLSISVRPSRANHQNSEMFRSAQHDRGIGFGLGLFALDT